MATDIYTSQRTSLGYVLQLVTEAALKRAKLAFEPNVLYKENFIKPDALLPGNPPTHTVHVTCTGADNSFQMKRWRYIDELLQMRSMWGTSFVSVNVMFGPVSGYQAGDRELIKRLFDYEIVVEELQKGKELFERAVVAVQEAQEETGSIKVAKELLEARAVSDTVDAIARELHKAATSSRVTRLQETDALSLQELLRTREYLRLDNADFIIERAYWKRSCLRFLAVPPDTWEEAFALSIRPQPPAQVSQRLLNSGLRAKLLSEAKGLVTRISCTPEIKTTLQAGLDTPFLIDLKEKVQSDPRRIFELQDLWDEGERAHSAVKEVSTAVQKGKYGLEALVHHSILQGGSPKVAHHRAHVLDVINVALGWSQNKMQQEYSGPSIGVADPIRNIVPRTEIAQQALKNHTALASGVSRSLVETTFNRLRRIKLDDSDLVDDYLAYRTYCLVKGSSIDPLQHYIHNVCESHGWSIENPNIICDHQFIGRTKTKFSIAASKGNSKLLVKCLFGDTGADHKAEEMEARMRILRTSSHVLSEATTVFVADGNWSLGHLTALHLGGWDHFVTVRGFSNLVQKLG